MLIAKVGSSASSVRATADFKKFRDNGKIVGYKNSQGDVAKCPGCNESVQPKLGKSVIHHWAHLAKANCKISSEPETEWHRKWKSYLPDDNIEVIIGNNRADIVTITGAVVELQHSGISIEEIEKRNLAYKRGVSYKNTKLEHNCFWLFDATKYRLEDYFECRMEFTKTKHTFYQYRWKNARKPWLAVQKGHLLIEFEDNLLYLAHHPTKWDSSCGKCLVYGVPLHKDVFVENFLLGEGKPDEGDVMDFFRGMYEYLQRLTKSKHSKINRCRTCGKISYDVHQPFCSDCNLTCGGCSTDRQRVSFISSITRCIAYYNSYNDDDEFEGDCNERIQKCWKHRQKCKKCNRGLCNSCEDIYKNELVVAKRESFTLRDDLCFNCWLEKKEKEKEEKYEKEEKEKKEREEWAAMEEYFE